MTQESFLVLKRYNPFSAVAGELSEEMVECSHLYIHIICIYWFIYCICFFSLMSDFYDFSFQGTEFNILNIFLPNSVMRVLSLLLLLLLLLIVPYVPNIELYYNKAKAL